MVPMAYSAPIRELPVVLTVFCRQHRAYVPVYPVGSETGCRNCRFSSIGKPDARSCWQHLKASDGKFLVGCDYS